MAEKDGYYNQNTDVLKFGVGIAPSDIAVVRAGNNLELRHANGSDKVIVRNWFASDGGRANKLEQVQFAGGTLWMGTQVNARGLTVQGKASADTLTANGSGTTFQGAAGDDTLIACVVGGLVWTLTFNGGPGDDQITGSYAEDTYIFNQGDGWDAIADDVRWSPGTIYSSHFASNPGAPDYQDRVQFGPTIDTTQLWFQRAGDDLKVSIIGSTDGMTITGWYTSMFREIEEFRLSDGRMLRNEHVTRLVEVMAEFAPLELVATSLPPEYEVALVGVIASSWF